MNMTSVLPEPIDDCVGSLLPLVLAIVGNDEDYEVVRRSFQQSSLATRLHRCQTGKQAIDYLQQSASNKHLIPDSILLDLHLDDAKSLKILAIIERNTSLNCIPTVMLANSQRAKDELEQRWFFGANTYLLKIADLANERFRNSIFAVFQYWFETVSSGDLTDVVGC